jgi:hypothetical protein
MKPNKRINNLYLRMFVALVIIVAFVAVFTSGKQFVEDTFSSLADCIYCSDCRPRLEDMEIMA